MVVVGWRVGGGSLVLLTRNSHLSSDNIVYVVALLYCHNLTILREILILLMETTGNSLMEMQLVIL